MKKIKDDYWISSDGALYKEAKNLLQFTDKDGINRQVWEVTNKSEIKKILHNDNEYKENFDLWENSDNIKKVDKPLTKDQIAKKKQAKIIQKKLEEERIAKRKANERKLNSYKNKLSSNTLIKHDEENYKIIDEYKTRYSDSYDEDEFYNKGFIPSDTFESNRDFGDTDINGDMDDPEYNQDIYNR